MVPSVVVKTTWVPLCGGVPAASITCAISCTVPSAAEAFDAAVNVMVEPEGARSGTFSQAADNAARASAAMETRRGQRLARRATMRR
jgi:hypothetical protein